MLTAAMQVMHINPPAGAQKHVTSNEANSNIIASKKHSKSNLNSNCIALECLHWDSNRI